MDIRQGEVYWLDLGHTAGSSPAERHPCVVVQSYLFNQSRIATTIVCLITSNLSRGLAPGNVYHVRVRSRTATGGVAVSADEAFFTAEP